VSNSPPRVGATTVLFWTCNFRSDEVDGNVTAGDVENVKEAWF